MSPLNVSDWHQIWHAPSTKQWACFKKKSRWKERFITKTALFEVEKIGFYCSENSSSHPSNWQRKKHFQLDFSAKLAPPHYLTVCKVSKREVEIKSVCGGERVGSDVYMGVRIRAPPTVTMRCATDFLEMTSSRYENVTTTHARTVNSVACA